MYHFIVLEYLKILYTVYWFTDDGPKSHKAFYKNGDANYKRVQAAEKRASEKYARFYRLMT